MDLEIQEGSSENQANSLFETPNKNPHTVTKQGPESQMDIFYPESACLKFNCTLCDLSFAGKPLLLNHLRSDHYGLGSNCSVCSQQFSSKFKLNQHMALKHNMHFCKDCREIFLSKVHDCLAKKRKVFTCDLEGCNGKNFKLYSFYLNHMMKVHGVRRDDEIARTVERIELENEKEKNKSVKISSFQESGNFSSCRKVDFDQTTRASTTGKKSADAAELTPVKEMSRARPQRKRSTPKSMHHLVRTSLLLRCPPDNNLPQGTDHAKTATQKKIEKQAVQGDS